jgi:hypothetical protein
MIALPALTDPNSMLNNNITTANSTIATDTHTLASNMTIYARQIRKNALIHLSEPLTRSFKPGFDISLDSDILNAVDYGFILLGNLS